MTQYFCRLVEILPLFRSGPALMESIDIDFLKSVLDWQITSILQHGPCNWSANRNLQNKIRKNLILTGKVDLIILLEATNPEGGRAGSQGPMQSNAPYHSPNTEPQKRSKPAIILEQMFTLQIALNSTAQRHRHHIHACQLTCTGLKQHESSSLPIVGTATISRSIGKLRFCGIPKKSLSVAMQVQSAVCPCKFCCSAYYIQEHDSCVVQRQVHS